ncbi:MAG: hypothetical protein K6G10_03980 [Butyrivibrio sp.]|nr:hypothetical protein [Butyrivibrio sp.]
MSEIERIYGKYIAMGRALVSGRKYTIAKWYRGYRFVVMCDNAPILAVRDNGSPEIIRPLGEKVYSQLKNCIVA